MKQLLLLLLCVPLLVFSQDEKRLALVIGNEDYDGSLKLNNPISDAILIKETLENLNFQVTLYTNLSTETEMYDSIDAFFQLRDSLQPKVTFIYYSGHGLQKDNQNFLIPTKERIDCIEKAERNTVKVEEIILQLKQTSEGNANILVLDACRNNPLPSCKKSKSVSNNTKLGLAKIPKTQGMLIAFSTDANEVAWDGELENSTYASCLSKYLLSEDVEIRVVFRKVRNDVERISGDQSPDMRDKLQGDLYLVKGDFEEEYKETWSLYNDNKFDDALEMISEIIGENRHNSRSINFRALIYTRLKKFDKALEDYAKSIEIDSESAEPYFNRGRIYWWLNKNDKALENLNKAIEIDPEHTLAYNVRAIIYMRTFKFAKALENYDKAIEVDPEYSYIYINRAVMHILKRYYQIDEKILNIFNEAININPDDPFAYYNRGRVYFELQKYNKALEDYDKAIEIDTENHHGYKYKSIVYYNLKQYDKALEELNIAIEKNPEDPFLFYYSSLIYDIQGRPQLAILNISRAIRIFPNGIWEQPITTIPDMIINDGFYSWTITQSDIDLSGKEIIRLSDLYIQLGNFLRKENYITSMCENYKKACDLGDCEMFNRYCKE